VIRQPLQPPELRQVDVGLYIHVAFCRSICYYCDFNRYAGLEWLIPRYVEALGREIVALPTALPGVSVVAPVPFRIGSVYFGGGTPSLLTPSQVEAILAAVHRWPVAPEAEVSLEANPGDLSVEHLRALRALGVNRLSLGIQSFDDAMLRRLGRRHDAATAIAALDHARQAGFDNVSLDLMFALPGQTLEHWNRTIDCALDLAPEHLSLYNLTIEPGTPFATWAEVGKLTVPDDDSAADMYEAAIDRLGAAGYTHYEISNWARCPSPCVPRPSETATAQHVAVSTRGPVGWSGVEHGRDYRAQHNLRYWRNQPYFGVGAGAHSSFGGYRYVHVSSPIAYVAQVNAARSPVEAAEEIDLWRDMSDTMMLGLRLAEGVSVDGFRERFGYSPGDVFGDALSELEALGLLTFHEGRISLTRRGRLLGNEVFCRFLAPAPERTRQTDELRGHGQPLLA
jgi:oxygen-independent coproporphyrinogen-3 oxidase